MVRHVLSRYLHTLRLDDSTHAVASGLALQRMVVSESVYAVLMLFADEPMTEDELVDSIELDIATPRETLGALWRSFVEKGFIVPEGFDEEAHLRKLVADRVVSARPFEPYQMPHRIDIAHLEVPAAKTAQLRHVEIVNLGGCLAQLAEEPLRSIAASYGLTIGVRSGWYTDTHLVASHAADLVIVQPGTYSLLAPLWGGAAYFDSEEQRRSALELLKGEITRIVRQLDGFSGFVLLQGVSTLQMPPYGRADDRLRTGHHAIVYELNQTMRELVADRPNMMFVDEERLASNHGKAVLFDDMIAATAHHGTLNPALPHLLAREYLDCFAILTGRGRIKCIVTDLDNTLWSGVLGEGDGPSVTRHPFPGIHEALALLKQRGILLVTCSKNNHDDVINSWPTDDPAFLRPDDFVFHSINWEAKSVNLASIMQRLGVAEDAVLFIDDNPVERAEVAARCPRLRILGADLATLRRDLLVDPSLQPNVISDEARHRTSTTRAQMSRDDERRTATDPTTFLRSLEIHINVARVTSNRHLGRVIELAQRTNQFNTTLIRYDAPALDALMQDRDASVWVMAVRDRFAAYGVVGLCTIVGDRIENICISCRTLALQVDQPFLVAALASSGLYARRAIGRIVIGERNQPSRRVFLDAGFSDLGEGLFARAPTPEPPTVDRAIYSLAVCDDSELATFVGGTK